MNTPILVIGFQTESTIHHFITYLRDININFEFLDLSLLTTDVCIGFEYDNSSLVIRINDQEFILDKYSAFYCRYYYKNTNNTSLNEVFSRLNQSLAAWLRNTDKKVVNYPGSGSSNYSKLSHLMELKTIGFNIPNTFIYGEMTKAQEALGDFDKWVSKGCSSCRTRVEAFNPTLYTNLDLLSFCPSQFQEKIEGVNVRVHIVGNQSIGLQITSPNIDYRYDTKQNEYKEVEVPRDIFDKCLLYCHQENLSFAGFDFIINEKGIWYILEANPMPGFEFFDRKINRKISSALAHFLIDSPVQPIMNCSINRPFIGAERRTKLV